MPDVGEPVDQEGGEDAPDVTHGGADDPGGEEESSYREEKTANTVCVINPATSVDNWKLISLGNPGSSAQYKPQNYLT